MEYAMHYLRPTIAGLATATILLAIGFPATAAGLQPVDNIGHPAAP